LISSPHADSTSAAETLSSLINRKFREPLSFVRREFPGLFEEALRVGTHGEIVARFLIAVPLIPGC
jgi:hypothetical protein